jgi:hypothetical protein
MSVKDTKDQNRNIVSFLKSSVMREEIEKCIAIAKANKCYVEISDIRDSTIGIPVLVSDEHVVFESEDGFEIDETNKLGTTPSGAERIFFRKAIYFKNIRHTGLIPYPDGKKG